MASELRLKKIGHKGGNIRVALLEGVIMPNGEFINNGHCQFLKKVDKIYIRKVLIKL